METVVGMANPQGGSIYLGVEDDGKVTGLHPEQIYLLLKRLVKKGLLDAQGTRKGAFYTLD